MGSGSRFGQEQVSRDILAIHAVISYAFGGVVSAVGLATADHVQRLRPVVLVQCEERLNINRRRRRTRSDSKSEEDNKQ